MPRSQGACPPVAARVPAGRRLAARTRLTWRRRCRGRCRRLLHFPPAPLGPAIFAARPLSSRASCFMGGPQHECRECAIRDRGPVGCALLCRGPSAGPNRLVKPAPTVRARVVQSFKASSPLGAFAWALAFFHCCWRNVPQPCQALLARACVRASGDRHMHAVRSFLCACLCDQNPCWYLHSCDTFIFCRV